MSTKTLDKFLVELQKSSACASGVSTIMAALEIFQGTQTPTLGSGSDDQNTDSTELQDKIDVLKDLTQEEKKTALQDKINELITELKAEIDELKDLTPEEKKTALQEKKTALQEKIPSLQDKLYELQNKINNLIMLLTPELTPELLQKINFLQYKINELQYNFKDLTQEEKEQALLVNFDYIHNILKGLV